MNDSDVQQVSEKTVLAQSAYMLFYVRQQPRRLAEAANQDRKLTAKPHQPAPTAQQGSATAGPSKPQAVDADRISRTESNASTGSSLSSISRASMTLAEPARAPFNATNARWNVSKRSGDVEVIEHRDATSQLASTAPWQPPQQRQSTVSVAPTHAQAPSLTGRTALSALGRDTPVWDDVDSAALYKRHEILEQAEKLAKRPRPTDHDQAYDRPALKKKKKQRQHLVQSREGRNLLQQHGGGNSFDRVLQFRNQQLGQSSRSHGHQRHGSGHDLGFNSDRAYTYRG
nr:hypothetical protein HK105_001403 [Polyrhizophydium stewartii]